MQNHLPKGRRCVNRAGAGMSNRVPPRYKLSLLGSFALSGPDGSVDLSSKKLVGLLAYLALTGPAPRSRDNLVGLLWGSHFEVQARQNLRQALFRLRRARGLNVLDRDAVDRPAPALRSACEQPPPPRAAQ